MYALRRIQRPWKTMFSSGIQIRTRIGQLNSNHIRTNTMKKTQIIRRNNKYNQILKEKEMLRETRTINGLLKTAMADKMIMNNHH